MWTTLAVSSMRHARSMLPSRPSAAAMAAHLTTVRGFTSAPLASIGHESVPGDDARAGAAAAVAAAAAASTAAPTRPKLTNSSKALLNQQLKYAATATELLDLFTAHSSEMRVMDLSVTASQLARLLGARDAASDVARGDSRADAVVGEIMTRLVSTAEEWKHREIANTLHSLSKLAELGAIDREGFDDFVAGVCTWISEGERSVAAFGSLGLSSMAHAIGNAACTTSSGKRLMEAIGDHVCSLDLVQLKLYSPQSLSNLVWAFASCHLYRTDLFDAIARHVMQIGVSIFSEQEVSMLMWACAKVPSEQGFSQRRAALFDAVANELVFEKLLRTYKPRNLATVMWAFAASDHLHVGLLNAAVDAVMRLDARGVHPQVMSNLAWAFAHLNHCHAGVFRVIGAFWLSGAAATRTIALQGVANTAWAFAVYAASAEGTKQLQAVCTVCAMLKRITFFEATTIQGELAWQLLTAHRLVVAVHSSLSPAEQAMLVVPTLPAHIHAAALQLQVDAHAKTRAVVHDRDRANSLQSKIVAALESLPSVGRVLEEVLVDEDMLVDARIVLKSGAAVLLEADGCAHFLSDSHTGERRVNGKTRLKHWRLRQRNEPFVVVTGFEWDAAHASQQRSTSFDASQAAFLDQMLQRAVAEAGARQKSAPPSLLSIAPEYRVVLSLPASLNTAATSNAQAPASTRAGGSGTPNQMLRFNRMRIEEGGHSPLPTNWGFSPTASAVAPRASPPAWTADASTAASSGRDSAARPSSPWDEATSDRGYPIAVHGKRVDRALDERLQNAIDGYEVLDVYMAQRNNHSAMSTGNMSTAALRLSELLGPGSPPMPGLGVDARFTTLVSDVLQRMQDEPATWKERTVASMFLAMSRFAELHLLENARIVDLTLAVERLLLPTRPVGDDGASVDLNAGSGQQRGLTALNEVGLAHILHSVARIGVGKRGSRLARAAVAHVEHLRASGAMDAFSMRTLTSIAASVVALKVGACIDAVACRLALDAVAAQVVRRGVQKFNARELTSIVSSMARNYHPCVELMDAVVTHFELGGAHNFQEMDVERLQHSFARMKHVRADLFSPAGAAAAIARASSPQSARPKNINAGPFASAFTVDALVAVHTTHASNHALVTTESLAVALSMAAKFADSDAAALTRNKRFAALVDDACARLAAQPAMWSHRSLATSTYALSKLTVLGIVPRAVFLKFVASLESALLDGGGDSGGVAAFDARGIALVLRALGRLVCTDGGERLLDALVAHIARTPRALDTLDDHHFGLIVSSLSACNRLATSGDALDTLVTLAERRCVAQAEPNGTLASACVALVACQRQRASAPLLDALVSRAKRRGLGWIRPLEVAAVHTALTKCAHPGASVFDVKL